VVWNATGTILSYFIATRIGNDLFLEGSNSNLNLLNLFGIINFNLILS